MLYPKYQHDCDNCYFLGSTSYEGQEYDLYLDYNENREEGFCTTLLACGSDEGGDYVSGSQFALIHLFNGDTKHPLAVALKRCSDRHWINHSTLELRIDDIAYARAFYQPHIKRTEKEKRDLLLKVMI